VIALVRICLMKPYRSIVTAAMILIIGVIAALRMPIDIFSKVNIPILTAAWQYTGLSPDDVAGGIATTYERVPTTTVNDIEHIESSSMANIGAVEICFSLNSDAGLYRSAICPVRGASLTALL